LSNRLINLSRPSIHKPALVLMARWPAAGRCKKRLSAQIGALNAASIQKRLTQHTLEVAKEVEKKGLIEIQLAITGLGRKACKRWGMSQGMTRITSQGEGSLGLRMKRQVLQAQEQYSPKYKIGRPTIIIGTDLPGLCTSDLMQAIDALKQNEIVIGPAKDGGYWLIGLSANLVNPVANWLFTNIPWSTDQVLIRTLHQANLEGVAYKLIGEKNDVDILEDLSPWQG